MKVSRPTTFVVVQAWWFLLVSNGLMFSASAFSVVPPLLPPSFATTTAPVTKLHMIGRVFRRRNRKVQTLERTEEKTKEKQKERKDVWRVMLYNTEYDPSIVAKILARVIPALDRKAAFELCLYARSAGKVALVVTSNKKQAETYCRGLQKRGLPSTVEWYDQER